MEYTKLNYKGFEKYLAGKGKMCGGYFYRFKFENDYGASVVKHDYSYGSKRDLFELAVMEGNELCYSTPITNDIIGYLSNDEVLTLLKKIKAL